MPLCSPRAAPGTAGYGGMEAEAGPCGGNVSLAPVDLEDRYAMRWEGSGVVDTPAAAASAARYSTPAPPTPSALAASDVLVHYDAQMTFAGTASQRAAAAPPNQPAITKRARDLQRGVKVEDLLQRRGDESKARLEAMRRAKEAREVMALKPPVINKERAGGVVAPTRNCNSPTHERLHGAARATQAKLEQQRSAMVCEELQAAHGRPAINKRSRSIRRGTADLLRWQQAKDAKVEREQRCREANALTGVTHTPRLNPTSLRMSEPRGASASPSASLLSIPRRYRCDETSSNANSTQVAAAATSRSRSRSRPTAARAPSSSSRVASPSPAAAFPSVSSSGPAWGSGRQLGGRGPAHDDAHTLVYPRVLASESMSVRSRSGSASAGTTAVLPWQRAAEAPVGPCLSPAGGNACVPPEGHYFAPAPPHAACDDRMDAPDAMGQAGLAAPPHPAGTSYDDMRLDVEEEFTEAVCEPSIAVAGGCDRDRWARGGGWTAYGGMDAEGPGTADINADLGETLLVCEEVDATCVGDADGASGGAGADVDAALHPDPAMGGMCHDAPRPVVGAALRDAWHDMSSIHLLPEGAGMSYIGRGSMGPVQGSTEDGRGHSHSVPGGRGTSPASGFRRLSGAGRGGDGDEAPVVERLYEVEVMDSKPPAPSRFRSSSNRSNDSSFGFAQLPPRPATPKGRGGTAQQRTRSPGGRFPTPVGQRGRSGGGMNGSGCGFARDAASLVGGGAHNNSSIVSWESVRLTELVGEDEEREDLADAHPLAHPTHGAKQKQQRDSGSTARAPQAASVGTKEHRLRAQHDALWQSIMAMREGRTLAPASSMPPHADEVPVSSEADDLYDDSGRRAVCNNELDMPTAAASVSVGTGGVDAECESADGDDDDCLPLPMHTDPAAHLLGGPQRVHSYDGGELALEDLGNAPSTTGSASPLAHQQALWSDAARLLHAAHTTSPFAVDAQRERGSTTPAASTRHASPPAATERPHLFHEAIAAMRREAAPVDGTDDPRTAPPARRPPQQQAVAPPPLLHMPGEGMGSDDGRGRRGRASAEEVGSGPASRNRSGSRGRGDGAGVKATPVWCRYDERTGQALFTPKITKLPGFYRSGSGGRAGGAGAEGGTATRRSASPAGSESWSERLYTEGQARDGRRRDAAARAAANARVDSPRRRTASPALTPRSQQLAAQRQQRAAADGCRVGVERLAASPCRHIRSRVTIRSLADEANNSSFAPKVLAESAKIDKAVHGGGDRVERLHAKQEEYRVRREVKIRTREREDELRLRAAQQHHARSRSGSPNAAADPQTFERQMHWARRREARLAHTRQAQEAQEVSSCTFQPSINAMPADTGTAAGAAYTRHASASYSAMHERVMVPHP